MKIINVKQKLLAIFVLCIFTFCPEKIISQNNHHGKNGALTETEMKIAKIAWKYFQNNYIEETGLVNSVDNYPTITLWDNGSYLGALVAAFELGIIDNNEFEKRMSLFLKTTGNLTLFNSELPNKVYNTKTLNKVDYVNKNKDLGYSALDIARYILWLKIVKERYPQYSNTIDNIMLSYDFSKIIDSDGNLYGGNLNEKNEIKYYQEGRLGYEEYCGKIFALWGFNTAKASKLEPYTTKIIYDIEIPVDSRDSREYGAHNAVLAESFILDGIELNWDLPDDKSTDDMKSSDSILTKELADRIFKVQYERFKNTGILTARSEHQLDESPYFVYDCIYANGYRWNTIDTKGNFVPEYAAVSTKAAFGLWVLWNSSYSDTLFNNSVNNYDAEKGFYEGIYENNKKPIKAFSANNNGIILECLLYKVQGKLLKYNSDINSLWDQSINEGTADKKRILDRQIKYLKGKNEK
ncbi:MAG: DUF3131 domain-containing protein [Candidatus Kapabacteria bacterium]|nr:DUF3131 domain-containing protein [Candidatus Kapabacteria bacterium]